MANLANLARTALVARKKFKELELFEVRYRETVNELCQNYGITLQELDAALIEKITGQAVTSSDAIPEPESSNGSDIIHVEPKETTSKELVVIEQEDLYEKQQAPAFETMQTFSADYMSAKSLLKKIRQIAHPDKLVRRSAEEKADMLDVLDLAEKAYKDDDGYDVLAFCWIYLAVTTGKLGKIDIPEYMESSMNSVDRRLEAMMQNFADPPYADAVIAHIHGFTATADKKFFALLCWAMPNRFKDELDDSDCFE